MFEDNLNDFMAQAKEADSFVFESAVLYPIKLSAHQDRRALLGYSYQTRNGSKPGIEIMNRREALCWLCCQHPYYSPVGFANRTIYPFDGSLSSIHELAAGNTLIAL